MKKNIITLVALFASLLTSNANAIPLQYTFAQDGYAEGASITGSFAGTDLNNDGQLSSFQGEISDYSMSFSGNSIVDAFSHTFSDFGQLVYIIGTPFIGDDFIGEREGIASGPLFGPDHPFSYMTGLGPMRYGHGRVTNNTTLAFDSDYTSNPATVTLVPEPATVALMSIGLAGLGFSSKRKKV